MSKKTWRTDEYEREIIIITEDEILVTEDETIITCDDKQRKVILKLPSGYDCIVDKGMIKEIEKIMAENAKKIETEQPTAPMKGPLYSWAMSKFEEAGTLIKRVREIREYKKRFVEQDQTLPIELETLKPKKQLEVIKNLEILLREGKKRELVDKKFLNYAKKCGVYID